MANYRNSIGTCDKYTFGTELEFAGVTLDRLAGIFKKASLPVSYELNHKWGKPTYDVWYLDTDSTVTKYVMGCAIGGELSSRIFTDQASTWEEIRSVCETLTGASATINPTCSNHIRVCLSSIKNKPQFFEVFSKLFAILENELSLFFMGEDYLVRDTQKDYSRPLKGHLLEYINTVNFQDPKEYFFEMRNARSGYLLFTNRDAINLNDFYEKQLMEIRYPNGTLNPQTIQNNINFILKLIDAIDRGLFNPEELTAQIDELRKRDWYMDLLYDRNYPKNFERLVHTISTSSEDINDFMTQYEHVLSLKKTVNK